MVVFNAQVMRDSVAQLLEQLTLNQWVESSSLSGVTSLLKAIRLRKLGRIFLLYVCHVLRESEKV